MNPNQTFTTGLKMARGCVADQPQHGQNTPSHRISRTRCGWSMTTQPRSGVLRPALSTLALVFGLTLNLTVADEFSPPSFYRALSLAPADAAPASGGGGAADAQTQAAELAKKLSNPVANLITVPIQNNWDFGIGPADAMRYTCNVQPVIPVTLNEEWNVITRTIVPLIYAESPVVGGKSESGLGDIVQSFFFSPKRPTASGWIWGAGPVFLWPTASDAALGTEKWGAGPTVVLLKQEHGWTYGALANHLWSYAGEDNRPDVSATFLQPFVAFTTKSYTTLTLNTESTYDWENEEWTVPLNLQVSQLLKIGKLPISFGIGARYYADKPAGGPDWGLRFVVQFLFPK